MRRTVHPTTTSQEIPPPPERKKWNPFLKLGSPQAAQLKMWFKKTVQRTRKYLCGDLKLHNNRPPARECISQTTGPRWHWINDVVNLLHFKQFSLPYTPFEACGAVFIVNSKIHLRKISWNEYLKPILHYFGVNSISGLTADRCGTEQSWNRPVFDSASFIWYPASRGYIFAVWAGVRKVASADNRSNPSRNLDE